MTWDQNWKQDGFLQKTHGEASIRWRKGFSHCCATQLMPHGGIELEEVVGQNELDGLEDESFCESLVDDRRELRNPEIQRFQTKICWNTCVETCDVAGYHP